MAKLISKLPHPYNATGTSHRKRASVKHSMAILVPKTVPAAMSASGQIRLSS